jgi:hypothetical protein
MWQFVMRQLLKKAEEQPFRQIGRTAAGMLFSDEANAPEAYVEDQERLPSATI